MELKFNWMNVTEGVPEQVQVLIEHTFTDGAFFRDALYFTPAEIEKISPEQISTMAQARVDAWIASLQAKPPAPPKSDKEQRAEMVESFKSTVTALASQVAAFEAKVEAEPDAAVAALR